MSGEFGAARLGFSKYALILAISNEKTGVQVQGPKFSVLRPPPPLRLFASLPAFDSGRVCGVCARIQCEGNAHIFGYILH